MSPALSQPRVNLGGWRHYVNDEWFDRPELAKDADLERLAFRLERFAKEKPYAITSNDELMEALGITRNTLSALLGRYELAGWGKRVLVTGSNGNATGRLGIVLYVRPTNRPVATPESFDQIVKMMHASVRRSKGVPRSVPFPSAGPDRSPKIGQRAPQILGTDGPQNLGTDPGSNVEEEIRGQKTTTTGPSLSSSLPVSSTPEGTPENAHAAVLSPRTRPPEVPAADESTHVPGEDPAAVAEAVRQAEDLFGPGMLKLVCRAIVAFTLTWVLAALHIARNRKNPAKGREPVEDWGFVWRTLENFRKQGGPTPKVLAAIQRQGGMVAPRASPAGDGFPTDPTERKRLAAEALAIARQRGLDETTFMPTSRWPSHEVTRWNALRPEIRELRAAEKGVHRA